MKQVVEWRPVPIAIGCDGQSVVMWARDGDPTLHLEVPCSDEVDNVQVWPNGGRYTYSPIVTDSKVIGYLWGIAR